jgi:hypothetical protein
MSVRDKLVELAYVRWELSERAAPAKRPTVVMPVRGATASTEPGVRRPGRLAANAR